MINHIPWIQCGIDNLSMPSVQCLGLRLVSCLTVQGSEFSLWNLIHTLRPGQNELTFGGIYACMSFLGRTFMHFETNFPSVFALVSIDNGSAARNYIANCTIYTWFLISHDPTFWFDSKLCFPITRNFFKNLNPNTWCDHVTWSSQSTCKSVGKDISWNIVTPHESSDVPNHWYIECLFNSLFNLPAAKTSSKLRITDPLWGKYQWPVDSPNNGPIMR